MCETTVCVYKRRQKNRSRRCSHRVTLSWGQMVECEVISKRHFKQKNRFLAFLQPL